MLSFRGINYFCSDWSECDGHLNSVLYDAMIKASRDNSLCVAILDRDYDSGMIKSAVILDDGAKPSDVEHAKITIIEQFKDAIKKSGRNINSTIEDMEIMLYDDLSKHGYSHEDIFYCFFWGNVFRRECVNGVG